MILGLSGYARTGKDTVAELLADYGYQRVAFADRFRAVAYDLNPIVHADIFYDEPLRLAELVDVAGWDRAKSHPEVRRTLQALGVAVREHVGCNTWVTAALDGIAEGDRVVVTDVRFKNEAYAIERAGGHILRVHRPGVDAVNDHISEHDLDDWPFDAHIHNDGTLDELRAQLVTIGLAGAAA